MEVKNSFRYLPNSATHGLLYLVLWYLCYFGTYLFLFFFGGAGGWVLWYLSPFALIGGVLQFFFENKSLCLKVFKNLVT
jgi:hypothetical protein